MNRWFRSALGVLAAILAFYFASLAIGTLRDGPGRAATTPGELIAQIALALVAAAMAGYLAAGIAAWKETVHGGIAGAFIGFGAGSSHFHYAGLPLPVSQLASLVVLAPAGLFGGWLRGIVMARRRERNPERPLALPVVIAPIRGFIVLGAVLGLAITAVGVLVLVKGWSPRVGWQTLLVFAPAAAFMLYRAAFPRPHLTIDEEGIFDHRLDLQFPWSDISGAVIRPFVFFDFVCFRVASPERYLERVSGLKRKMLTNDGLFSKTPFGITLSGTGIRPEALCDLVNTEAARRNSPPPPSA